MEILKRGRDLQKSTWQITCEFCRAELLLTPDDFRIHRGPFARVYSCTCPCCKLLRYYEPFELPKDFRAYLSQK